MMRRKPIGGRHIYRRRCSAFLAKANGQAVFISGDVFINVEEEE